MSNKMGRPPTPKAKAKSVLLGAKLSPSEAAGVEKEVARLNQDKSKWLRDVVKVEIGHELPVPKWFKSSLTTEQLDKLDGKTIEFTLTGHGFKVHDIGKLLVRRNEDGQTAIDIDVVEFDPNKSNVTRYFILPPLDSKIEIHPDQSRARFRLST